MKQQLRKYTIANAKNIIDSLECSEALKKELFTLPSDKAVLEKLLAGEQYSEAIKFLAKGLPKREAIWWAYLASESLEKECEDEVAQQALAAVKGWVQSPDESKRREAGQLGKALEFYTPSSWAAMAVFWSGGSIMPEGRAEVEASDEMCAEAVANAIIISAQKSSEDVNQFQFYIKQGLHIAMGGNGLITVD